MDSRCFVAEQLVVAGQQKQDIFYILYQTILASFFFCEKYDDRVFFLIPR